jgi:ankyrin repeat protein
VFSNPPDALPLPPRPNLEQYRKLAKELIKACRSKEQDAIETWARQWIEHLAGRQQAVLDDRAATRLSRTVRDVARFAESRLSGGSRKCVLADAQFVIARSHGFASWPELAAHLDAVAHSSSETADFEAAVDAIVAGDEATLRRLLQAAPELVRARSTREHRGTLLHYVSANGVEGYRQKTPPNAVTIAETLLAAGSEVDAEAEMYGGKCTTLGLVATSVHPQRAGVQKPLMQLLIDHGADIAHLELMGNGHSAVMGCLANGQPEAGAFLAERGAQLGLVEAAGVGRLDLVRAYFDERVRTRSSLAQRELHAALAFACSGGSENVVEFLIDRGVDPKDGGGDRQTALHHAVIGGQLAIVKLLIARGAQLEARNVYGGTVLGQTLWSAAHGGDPDTYAAIIETLITAGARVPRSHPPINEKIDNLLARLGSASDPTDSWYGEDPRA